MLMKRRTKSTTHRILESLNNRMVLSYEDKINYQNQVKGFEGECLFDQYLNHSQQTGLIINDLLLNAKNTFYQMDSLLIINHRIYLYEVKNYSGSYTFKEGTLYAESGHLIQNPLAQVERKQAYLHNLLLNLGYEYTVSAYVAYVNPDFYIYSLPQRKSILFHGQLERHFKQIAPRKRTRQDEKVAEFLVSNHLEDYRPNYLPDYTFHNLKKGIICPECKSFEYVKTRLNRTCTTCGFKEKIADAIHRNIVEFQLLFPEIPLNVPNIVLWCEEGYSDYHIRQVLNKNFTLHLKGSKSFYA